MVLADVSGHPTRGPVTEAGQGGSECTQRYRTVPSHQNTQIKSSKSRSRQPQASSQQTASTTSRLTKKVEVDLEKAGLTLNIKDTADWVAAVTRSSGRTEINPAKTYSENGLSGTVEIEWGPRHGGGG